MGDKVKKERGSFGVEFSPNILRRACIIMIYLKDGQTPVQVAKNMKVKRETLSYWISKLVYEGLIYCTNPQSNKNKQYKTTPAGESFLVANESTVKNEKPITTENARFKCYIRNKDNFLPFIQYTKYQFKQISSLRNNVVYDGNVEGIHIRIIHGARHIENVTMLMIAPKFSGTSAKEAEFLMFRTMLQFQDYIDKKWNLDLSRITIDSTHVEYTWNSQFSKAMMTKHKGSPMKNEFFSINQSPPSLMPKEEWHDADEMDKHIILPDIVESVRKEVEEIRSDNYGTSYKIEQLENAVKNLAESTRSIAESGKMTNQNVSVIATKVTELVELIQGKKISDQGKIEENDIPLNDITKTMYG